MENSSKRKQGQKQHNNVLNKEQLSRKNQNQQV